MEKRLYVGNLPFDTTEDDLHQLFSAHGQIVSAKLITDMETGRSRGFGFVEMSTEDEAKAAIASGDNQHATLTGSSDDITSLGTNS